MSLNGKTIDFVVLAGSAGSASTNSSGIAMRAYTPFLAAGTWATGASFAGDALYNASTDSGTIAIAKKATTLTYTGVLTGGPNKTVSLSATLVDATGTPLSGRIVVFKLGSQTTQAATVDGVASISLKLTQKNGSWPLTATWTPSGDDAMHYLGSIDSKTFKLQSR